jgi:hypothetical protein
VIAALPPAYDAALPRDVRKGSAFPIKFKMITGAMPPLPSRRSLSIRKSKFRKAGGFPHIKRQSREAAIRRQHAPSSYAA